MQLILLTLYDKINHYVLQWLIRLTMMLMLYYIEQLDLSDTYTTLLTYSTIIKLKGQMCCS